MKNCAPRNWKFCVYFFVFDYNIDLGKVICNKIKIVTGKIANWGVVETLI